MSNEGERKFIYTLIVWLVGLILANAGCSYFSALDWGVLASIPAIESYAKATAPAYMCTARGVWTYAWLAAPIVFVWLAYLGYREPVGERTPRQKYWGAVLIFGIFALFFLSAFFGMYDPYPGTDKGRWAAMYRESELGVLTLTVSLWVGGLSMFLMGVIWLTELLKLK